MGLTTSSGERADYRYVNNGLRPYRFSDLGVTATHENVQGDFSPKFARAVQIMRHKVGFDIPINSGYRSIDYNNRIYRARGQRPTKDSRHTHGDAIDVNLAGMSTAKRKQILEAALQSGFTSVGFYSGSDMMHIDARANGTTWGPRPDWAKPVMAAEWRGGMPAYQRDYLKDFAEIPTLSAQRSLRSSYLTAGDRDILIRTVVGEAAGEGTQGMEAVAHVIKNRTTDSRWPDTASAVALQPAQFSAWNAASRGGNSLPQRITPNDSAYKEAAAAVDRVFNGESADPTNGAVYYYAPQGMKDGNAPAWWTSAVNERGGSTTIGNHRFAGRTRGDQTGQGLSASTGTEIRPAPQTMRVQVTEPVDPKNWTQEQELAYMKTHVMPTTTKWVEKKVPGSDVEAQHRASTQPSTAPQSDKPANYNDVISRASGGPGYAIESADIISNYLAQQLASEASVVQEAVSFALGNTGRNKLTPIDPISAMLGD